ncbi:tRNA(m(1)G37)methyltransferase [Xanthoria parietina]
MNQPSRTLASTDMFRPPINRAMRSLDRAFFRKDVYLAAACVLDSKLIATYRNELHGDILKLERLPPIRPIPPGIAADKNTKCLLLKPDIQIEDRSSWSPKLHSLVESQQLLLTPFHLQLDYNYWTYHDIISAILPQQDQDEIPVGFSVVGHVAHLNLRDRYLPYKTLIASVLIDKNPTIRTVINKIDDVGEENEFRTFRYEVLAGPDDMNVEVKEQDCLFSFDYSKVYWNTRLGTEHPRLVSKFKPGEAVCDVMAGVGPFALPAAKNKVWVWANDLNPESHRSLVANTNRNKVAPFVRPFCEDGHSFIRSSSSRLLDSKRQITLRPKVSRTARTNENQKPFQQAPSEILKEPKVFSHYILNLPASALTFLPSFIGLYSGHDHLFHPYTGTKLPMIHVYCFSTKSDDNKIEEAKIREEVGRQLGYEFRGIEGAEMEIWDVRDVAPQKRMFCASFRLPAEVAFRERIPRTVDS